MRRGQHFDEVTVGRPINSHTKDELPESGYPSPELDSLQAEIRRHPAHHHREERSLKRRIFAKFSESFSLLIVLSILLLFVGLPLIAMLLNLF